MSVKVNINVSDLYVIMCRNFFGRFSKVMANVWRSMDRDGFYSYEKQIFQLGHIPKTYSTSKQIEHIQKKMRVDIKSSINECMSAKSSSEMSRKQDRIIRNISTCTDIKKKDKKYLEKLVKDATNTNYGIKNEGNVIKCFEKETGLNVNDNQHKYYYKVYECDNIEWMLIGKVDGITECGKVIEIKNRTRKLFNELRNYEEPQIMTYLWLSNTSNGYMVESYKKNGRVNMNILDVVYKDGYYDEKVLPAIIKFITFFMDKIKDDNIKRMIIMGEEDELYNMYKNYFFFDKN